MSGCLEGDQLERGTTKDLEGCPVGRHPRLVQAHMSRQGRWSCDRDRSRVTCALLSTGTEHRPPPTQVHGLTLTYLGNSSHQNTSLPSRSTDLPIGIGPPSSATIDEGDSTLAGQNQITSTLSASRQHAHQKVVLLRVLYLCHCALRGDLALAGFSGPLLGESLIESLLRDGV